MEIPKEIISDYEPEAIKNYFEKADLVALGESSHGTHTEIVMTFLNNFGEIIDGFFIEIPIDEQKDIDEYISTGNINQRLTSHFAGALKEGKDVKGNLVAIMDKLKELGKPLICVDSPKKETDEYKKKTPPKQGYYFLKGESRDDDMCENILAYMDEHPGKYLFMGGSWHLEKGKDRITGLDSLDERLRNALDEKYLSVLMTHEEGIDDSKLEDYDEVLFEPGK